MCLFSGETTQRSNKLEKRYLSTNKRKLLWQCITFCSTLFIEGVRQRQTGISSLYRKCRYQALWYQYRSGSSDFLSLRVSVLVSIDLEACAFLQGFGRNILRIVKSWYQNQSWDIFLVSVLIVRHFLGISSIRLD